MTININGTTGISGVNGSATTPALQGDNDTNTGISFDTDEVNIVTGGTTKATVDSTGNLVLDGGSDVRIELGSNGTTETNDRNHIRGDGDNIKLNTCADGLFIFEQNGTEEVRIQSGGGISFNGDTAAANALDDYEEGTWTPTITGNTTAGTTTYAVQSASYLKIGGIVTVTFYVQWSSGTGTGAFVLGGLPFTTANDLTRLTTGSVMMDNVSFSGDYVVPYSQFGTTTSLLYATTAGSSWGPINFDSAGALIGQLTYRTN